MNRFIPGRLTALLLTTAWCLLLAGGEVRAAAPADSCATITYGPPPPYDGPYPTVEALCRTAPRGQPAPRSLIPPTGPKSPAHEQAYAERVQEFITRGDYRPLGWLSDAHWRLTGPYQGCPPNGSNFGVHPLVHIYYSPEVIDWLCRGKQGAIPDGAMIVKEMADIDQLIVDPQTRALSAPQSTTVSSWTVMIKGQGGSHDGWYWGFFSAPPPGGNPPIVNRSAAIPGYLPDHPSRPDPDWLPTGNDDVLYPNASFGNYCTNCHSSTEHESTYSSLKNIIGQELTYEYLVDAQQQPGRKGLHERQILMEKLLGAKKRATAPAALAASSSPFPPALPTASPGFLATFPQLPDVPFPAVWETRFPAETWDHVTSAPGPSGPAPFLTSDQCSNCHDDTESNASQPNMVLPRKQGLPLNLSAYGEWRASPMGLAGRDPMFYSQLESELDLASNEPGLKGKGDCVQSLCLHCHGVMGQRQLALDTGGQGSTAGLCPEFLAPESRKGAKTAGQRFTRDLVDAWPKEGDEALAQKARYGALARDGISCTVCHHISTQDIGQPQTFTGNFNLGPSNELAGPYQDVVPRPMQNELNLTPKRGVQVKLSALCASCHAIDLPVLTNDGTLVDFKYEQATFLEWLNSDFAGKNGQSCQDCHMRTTHDGTPLRFKIANIEDATFPRAEGRLPDKDIALKERAPYPRHTLYGLNLFLNAYFQQFPLLLGIRQIDFLNSYPEPSLLTARDATLQIARSETADFTLGPILKGAGALTTQVTVTNKTGHDLPSGVGFRRAFIELQVLDGDGKLLWASGRTSPEGVILLGTTDQPLPSEFFRPGPDGKQAYQPHHVKITDGAQAQIYEELVQDSARQFTTSFLHRVYDVKDNRLRPRGWRANGPFAKDTRPIGTDDDPAYRGPVLTGSDTVTYEMAMPPDVLARARTVQATLYYQSTPPYFLMQRFTTAAQGPLKSDTERLYYLASHLNVDAPSRSGVPYLKGWKLQVASVSRPVP